MAHYQVTCISRDGSDPDHRIDEIGIHGEKFPIDTVIYWLQSDQHTCWVHNGVKPAMVGVKQHPSSKRFYLVTEPDGIPLNNIKSLPECP